LHPGLLEFICIRGRISFPDFLRNDNSNDTRLIASLTHSAKGECRARGIAKVGDIIEEMQYTAMSKSLSDNEVIQILTRLLGEVKVAFVVAHDKIRVFYREPQREIEW
jgi:hypothetical protein